MTSPSRRPFLLAVLAAAVLIVVVAVVLRFVVVPGLQVQSIEQHLARHEPEQARDRLELILAKQPTNREALLLAAKAARLCQLPAEAERHLTQFEEVNRGPTDASRFEFTLLGIQQGDIGPDDERLLQSVTRENAYAVDILLAFARGMAVHSRWVEATQLLDKLLELDADHTQALILRGTVASQIRRFDAADKDFAHAVESSPDNAAALYAYAEHLRHRGYTRKAIVHYEKAAELRPTDDATRLGWAKALADAGEFATAEATLKAIDGRHVGAQVELGRLALKQDHFADAEVHLRAATQLAPWHRDAFRLLLTTVHEQNKSAEATKVEAGLNELILDDGLLGKLKIQARDNGGDTVVRWQLHEWCVRNHEPAESAVWLYEILRAKPDHAEARAALASHYDQTGQPRRAANYRK